MKDKIIISYLFILLFVFLNLNFASSIYFYNYSENHINNSSETPNQQIEKINVFKEIKENNYLNLIKNKDFMRDVFKNYTFYKNKIKDVKIKAINEIRRKGKLSKETKDEIIKTISNYLYWKSMILLYLNEKYNLNYKDQIVDLLDRSTKISGLKQLLHLVKEYFELKSFIYNEIFGIEKISFEKLKLELNMLLS